MTDAFVESEVVQSALEDIMDLQMEVMMFSNMVEYATIEQQKENLQTLKELHKKQKNMFFRCQLCPESDAARTMVLEILTHFEQCGYDVDLNDPISVFDIVEQSLIDLEVDIRNQEELMWHPHKLSHGLGIPLITNYNREVQPSIQRNPTNPNV